MTRSPIPQPDWTNAKRFVVLRHKEGKGFARAVTAGESADAERSGLSAHFDWMFEKNGTLRTWSTVCLDSLGGIDSATSEPVPGSVDLPCDRLPDHRLAYLDFEGDISGDRGCVSRVIDGSYVLVIDDMNRFEARMSWSDGQQSHVAVVCIYRSRELDDRALDDKRPLWRLSFSTG